MVGAGFMIIALCLLFYFLPWVIAMRRNRSNTASIFVINLFLGWTLVGWVVALAWSLASDERAVAKT